ncbi:response regulator transcription factor [Salibacterium halotolerans]|uniref:DNA-binding response regulator, OmpR family, contains REC and winged-helix (WHTH) domain n=1 Tax=Salibacterium halotolerans TaxID=1884432 RepID=A0A1I5QGQ3_9BACI|nr:response regulator transcription factor [Salibacterium halotolerans]SFP45180.1 DNA-binding response regulator, OmpR family, contains REC and winged-helix (wHTH) domain [Salibacterium halotolerans]
MVKKKILIVEDEEDIRRLITMYLNKRYDVVTIVDGNDVLDAVKQTKPDLILLDIMLPGKSGIEICADLREYDQETPILFLSAKREFEDKIQGLDTGADDYITKPFDPGELVARIQANLRRHDVLDTQNTQPENVLTAGDLEIDLNSFTLRKKGKTLHLFAKEMQLLLVLARHPNQVLSMEQLYDNVWGTDRFGDLKTVSVHISNLRKKIEEDPAKPAYIQTVRGFGYKFSNLS